MATCTRVMRSRGATPGPALTANAISQMTAMIGSTTRSSVMLIGAPPPPSWSRSNGVSQNIAINPAIDHGRTRVVLGQSPAARSVRRERGAGRPA